jgi:hypothetical protein
MQKETTRREALKAGIAVAVLGAGAEAEAQGLTPPSKRTPCSIILDPGAGAHHKLNQPRPLPFVLKDTGAVKCLVPGKTYQVKMRGCHLKNGRRKKVAWSDPPRTVARQVGTEVHLSFQSTLTGTVIDCDYPPPFKGPGDLTITVTDVATASPAVPDTPISVTYDE